MNADVLWMWLSLAVRQGYLDALIRYNKALVQRNTLLKSEQPVEEELFLVWEEMMAQAGEVVSDSLFLLCIILCVLPYFFSDLFYQF